MRTLSQIVTALAVLGGVAVACSSTSGHSDAPTPCPNGVCPGDLVCVNGRCEAPGTGGVGGEGGMTGNVCIPFCDRAANEVVCPNGTADACEARCESLRNQYPSCVFEFDTMIKCATPIATAICDDSGLPSLDVPQACPNELGAYSACTQTGTGGGTGEDAAAVCVTSIQGTTCDVLKPSDPCQLCLRDNCCGPYEACLADYMCAGLMECILANGCDKVPDSTSCMTAYCSQCAAGAALFNDYSACAQMCSTPCAGA